jgi:hypothetical protein
MKKIGMLAVLCGLFMFNIGCEDKPKAPAPTPSVPTTQDTKTTPDGSKTSTDTKTLNPDGSKTDTKSTTKTTTDPAPSK